MRAALVGPARSRASGITSSLAVAGRCLRLQLAHTSRGTTRGTGPGLLARPRPVALPRIPARRAGTGRAGGGVTRALVGSDVAASTQTSGDGAALASAAAGTVAADSLGAVTAGTVGIHVALLAGTQRAAALVVNGVTRHAACAITTRRARGQARRASGLAFIGRARARAGRLTAT